MRSILVVMALLIPLAAACGGEEEGTVTEPTVAAHAVATSVAQPSPQLPAPTRPGFYMPSVPLVPRPDETYARSVAEARKDLVRNADLAAVITAAEAADISRLLKMAQPGDGNYCSLGRGELPPECTSRDQHVDTVSQQCGGRMCTRPIGTMTSWLDEILSNMPVELDFASRDSRLPEGNGGKYYLMFKTARPSDGILDTTFFGPFEAVGVVVSPDESKPIESFAFATASNGLAWVQSLGGICIGCDGAKYQLLLAPETVKGVHGAWGETQHGRPIGPSPSAPPPVPTP